MTNKRQQKKNFKQHFKNHKHRFGTRGTESPVKFDEEVVNEAIRIDEYRFLKKTGIELNNSPKIHLVTRDVSDRLYALLSGEAKQQFDAAIETKTTFVEGKQLICKYLGAADFSEDVALGELSKVINKLVSDGAKIPYYLSKCVSLDLSSEVKAVMSYLFFDREISEEYCCKEGALPSIMSEETKAALAQAEIESNREFGNRLSNLVERVNG